MRRESSPTLRSVCIQCRTSPSTKMSVYLGPDSMLGVFSNLTSGVDTTREGESC